MVASCLFFVVWIDIWLERWELHLLFFGNRVHIRFHTFFLLVDFFGFVLEYIKMFGQQTPSSSASASASTGGMFGSHVPAPSSPTRAIQGTASGANAANPEREKLEPRLSALLMAQGVAESTLDTFGKVGITSIALFANLAVKKDLLRQLLEKPGALRRRAEGER